MCEEDRVSGSCVDTNDRQYFGRHGIYVRIGYRLSSLDMGPCGRICRLGAILGRGTGTSKILGLGLGFRGAEGSTRTAIFWRRHGIYVRIGYRLSSLDMGPCARIRRLGAILGRGASTSIVRVNGLGLGLGLDTQLTQSRCALL